MSDIRYHVGDYVQVKSFDEMAAEYGVDDDGFIKTNPYCFPPEMKFLCEEVFQIKEVICNGRGQQVRLISKEGIENHRHGVVDYWCICPAMVKPFETELCEQDIDMDAWAAII